MILILAVFNVGNTFSQRTVVSTFASPHEPTLKPKACKRVSAFPAHVTNFQDVLRITHAQKNKINLCSVDRFVQIDNDPKIKAKQLTNR